MHQECGFLDTGAGRDLGRACIRISQWDKRDNLGNQENRDNQDTRNNRDDSDTAPNTEQATTASTASTPGCHRKAYTKDAQYGNHQWVQQKHHALCDHQPLEQQMGTEKTPAYTGVPEGGAEKL